MIFSKKKVEKLEPAAKTDLEVARDFFKILKNNQIEVKEATDWGFQLKVSNVVFCFHETGEFWKVME